MINLRAAAIEEIRKALADVWALGLCDKHLRVADHARAVTLYDKIYARIAPEFPKEAVEHYIYDLAKLAYHDYAQLDSDALEKWVTVRLADLKRLWPGEAEPVTLGYMRKGNRTLIEDTREGQRREEYALQTHLQNRDGTLTPLYAPAGDTGIWNKDRRIREERRSKTTKPQPLPNHP